MAVTSYPFDGQVTTETQFSKLFRELQDSGIAASADSLAFKVSADASGMNVKVQPGYAILRGHAVESTAVETLTINAAGASLRTDRVVLRLDPTTNSITLVVLTGASATPWGVTQTDTGVFELSLATVTVDPNVTNIASTKTTDDRRFVGANVQVYSSRPSAPRKGLLGFNTTTSVWEFWTGTAWTDLLAWASVSGKPATFPPSTHTHDPSAYSVSYASSAGNADTVDGQHASAFAGSGHGHDWGSLSVNYANSAGYAPTNGHGHDYAATGHGHDYMYHSGDWSYSGQLQMSHGNPLYFSGLAAGGSVGVSLNSTGVVLLKSGSARRFKRDIDDLEVDLDALREITPRQFRYDGNADEVYEDSELMGGFIAEEVAEAFPLAVLYNEDGSTQDIHDRTLLAGAFALIKDLSARVEQLEAMVTS